jgi:hypothetical protein
MPKGFKFTQENLDQMVLDAMNQPATTQTGAKPNVLKGLLAKVGLGNTATPAPTMPPATPEVATKGK